MLVVDNSFSINWKSDKLKVEKLNAHSITLDLHPNFHHFTLKLLSFYLLLLFLVSVLPAKLTVIP